MRACLYFHDPLTVGKFAIFEKKIKKKDAETYAIVLLQYLGQRESKSHPETSWERQVEEQEIKEQQCCAVQIVTITVSTSDITSQSQACS